MRAAVNLALAGALAGKPPPATLAARLTSCIENTDIMLALLGSVERGLPVALAEEVCGGLHTADRQALLLFLVASCLDGELPPDELLRRIRLLAHTEIPPKAKVLIGLAALDVADEDVLEVARPWVDGADGRAGRRIARDILRRMRRPLREALPEEAPPELFGGFTIVKSAARPGRNDPCHCGSGKKYKKCCLTKDRSEGPRRTRPARGEIARDSTAR